MSAFIRSQRGFSLIEVLVTVLILSTSLLAMGTLQNRSLQFNHSAYLRSQANVLAYDILDRMRINSDNLAGYAHDLGDAKPSASGQLANKDLNEWLTSAERTLPGGRGSVSCDGRLCTVTLAWTEQAELDEEPSATSEDTVRFSYSSRI